MRSGFVEESPAAMIRNLWPRTREGLGVAVIVALRSIMIVAGAVAVLFTLTFVAYVAFEFVLAPLVRYFA